MKKQKKKEYRSCVKNGDKISEIIYDPDRRQTFFTTYESGKFTVTDHVLFHGQPIYPIKTESAVIQHRVVLLPSRAEDYGSEEDLINVIRTFIHKYLEISPFFERMAPFYVLFTWGYDKFKELPYLRAIADYGQGKSRFLKTIGSVCYKPMFTVGATTPAPIFRLISQFKGTLILDEADYRFSDTNAEIVKILNNGFQTGMPILRCSDSKNNYDIQAFDVFCPKIVATRNTFQDKALESRFLVEHMDGKLTRKDIPINLDDTFDKEALEIRNKCLAWRLKNYANIDPALIEHDKTLEPRLSQIIAPLQSIIKDEEIRKELKDFIRDYNKELIKDRSLNFETPLLETIITIIEKNTADKDITMQSIADSYNINFKEGKELSARKIGFLVRNKLRLDVIRTRKGYILGKQNLSENIEKLRTKYGIESEQVNDVNVTEGSKDEFKKELEEIGCYDIPEF